MGLYDTLRAGRREFNTREGQIKIWSNELEALRVYVLGDVVPTTSFEDPEAMRHQTYSIAMREGGYVNIFGQRFISWTAEALYSPVIDKYGELFTAETQGELKEALGHDPYLFKNRLEYLLPEEMTEKEGEMARDAGILHAPYKKPAE